MAGAWGWGEGFSASSGLEDPGAMGWLCATKAPFPGAGEAGAETQAMIEVPADST